MHVCGCRHAQVMGLTTQQRCQNDVICLHNAGLLLHGALRENRAHRDGWAAADPSSCLVRLCMPCTLCPHPNYLADQHEQSLEVMTA